MWVALVVIIVAVCTLAFTWETWLEWFVYESKLVDCDRVFSRTIATADRIVVSDSGFTCHHDYNETNILFVVTNKVEIEAVRNNIRFPEETQIDMCLCCGWPRIEWYKGNKKLALTSVQHGAGIRWRGFSQYRLLGFQVGYGDAGLTKESQAWLKEWLESHGIKGKAEEQE